MNEMSEIFIAGTQQVGNQPLRHLRHRDIADGMKYRAPSPEAPHKVIPPEALRAHRRSQ